MKQSKTFDKPFDFIFIDHEKKNRYLSDFAFIRKIKINK